MKLKLAVCIATLAFAGIVLSAEPAKTASQKKVMELYQKSLKADALMGTGKYAEAMAAYEPVYGELSALVEDDDGAASFSITVKPNELGTTKLLGLDYTELNGSGTGEIRADRYSEVLADVYIKLHRVFSDDDYYTDSQIAAEAIGVVKEVKRGVPDPETPSAAVRLKLAVAQLQGVIGRSPTMALKTINEMTPAMALKDGKAKLPDLEKKASAAKAGQNAAMPQGAQIALETALETLDDAIASLKKDGFVADSDFEKWIIDAPSSIKTFSATMKKYYDDEGKVMPAEATKPISDKAAVLRDESTKSASSYSFPAGLVPDSDISSAVTSQLVKNVKGVKVIKVAMDGKEWNIKRNDIGLVESRVRYGYALYQMPGEQFARCSRFSYREQFDGQKYGKADGAESYSATRWQLPR